MATVVAQPIQVMEHAIDWESPAGGAPARARLSPCAYIYCGFGSRHWMAQPCDILPSAKHTDEVDVVFACGCRARVPRDRITRRRN